MGEYRSSCVWRDSP